MFDRIRTEMEIDRERRKHALAIAESAGALASTIDAVVKELPQLNLSAAEQTTFTALAVKLLRQTERLQKQATRNHIDAIPGTLEQMALTCTSCHQLFRRTIIQEAPRGD
ncbi:MAG: cytochrome c [Chromatiales bacterium]|nr:cytochrome c [Chromatiales bacterium]